MSDLHPTLPNSQYITELQYALGLHQAASESRLMRNRTAYQGLAPAIVPQRQQLLDIITDMLIIQRDKALDQFCTSWLKYRNLPIPEKE